MKLGLDFHGVTTAAPKFFSVISKLLVENGHEVHIITGIEDSPQFRKHLEEMGIVFTHVFSITTHCRGLGEKVRYDTKGTPWLDENAWSTAKGIYCKEQGIDIHFDDSQMYSEYFETPFVLFQKLL